MLTANEASLIAKGKNEKSYQAHNDKVISYLALAQKKIKEASEDGLHFVVIQWHNLGSVDRRSLEKELKESGFSCERNDSKINTLHIRF